MSTYILGLCVMTDASAALVRDGAIVAAVEEERFTRVKHQKGYPKHSIDFCLEEAGITFADVDYVVLYWKPRQMGHRILHLLRYALKHPRLFLIKLQRGASHLEGDWKNMMQVESWLNETYGRGKYEYLEVEHHLTHAATAFFLSPFEESAILTMDGTGESTTTMLARGQGTQIEKLQEIRLPHSLGHFYSSITGYLGFKMLQDEYKVMGMAAAGNPIYKDLLLEKCLIPKPPDSFHFETGFIDYHAALRGEFVGSIVQELGPPRDKEGDLEQHHFDLAASAQVALEEVTLQLGQHLYDLTGSKNLSISGGVGLNCLMNKRLIEELPFEEIYVPPCCHDAGGALGAAIYVHHHTLNNPRDLEKHHLLQAYLGPGYSNEACKAALDQHDDLAYEFLEDEVLIPRVAQALADGHLIAWFQGRSEYGPRALGDRSFLADPRLKDAREVMNLQIKRREPFRPFAPSVLVEHAAEYFGRDEALDFMTIICDVNPEKQDLIPAVVHADGTARPQTVRKEANPRYWELIHAFYEITGIPLLLNTSFNIQEPIVNAPEEAINCFQRCSVKYLVLENYLVWKKA